MRVAIIIVLLLLFSSKLALAQAPTSSEVMPSASTLPSQLDSLIERLRSAKEIRFDAIDTGTVGQKRTAPLEVTGVVAGEDALNVTVFRAGKAICRIIGHNNQAILYIVSTRRYVKFEASDISADDELTDPYNFMYSPTGEFLSQQADGDTNLAFFSVMMDLRGLSEIIDELNGQTPLTWAHSVTSSAVRPTEHDIGRGSVHFGSVYAKQNIEIIYSADPWAILQVFSSVTTSEKPGSMSDSQKFKYCNVITDSHRDMDVNEFVFSPPVSAKQVILSPVSAESTPTPSPQE
jgi:hypothetical protein